MESAAATVRQHGPVGTDTLSGVGSESMSTAAPLAFER